MNPDVLLRKIRVHPRNLRLNSLLKIIDHDFFHERLHALRDEFQMLRMHLVIILRLLARENRVERDLIRLIHDGPRAAGHFADVKMREAGNVFQKFISASDDGICRFGFRRVGPENDNV